MIPLHFDYIEFAAPDLETEQAFMGAAFGWSFIDYGPDYRDIQNAGSGGGLERGDLRAPLIVLRSDDLDGALAQVTAAGATITKPPFDFPGGRRFEFTTPAGTAMAVWVEQSGAE